MSSEQSRQHSGHSHGGGHHHHHHDNTYLTSANKKDAGVRITRIGLYVNLVMAVGKGFGGWLFHSHALVADAGHALTDLVSDFMTLGTVAWALKPPTSRFPSGYGKIESLGSLGVSSLLLTGGILMGLNACDVLCHEFFDFHFLPRMAAHTHSHMPPNINAAWLAAGSIVVKEWLYRATMKVAKERKSSVLASNAVHHRVDCLTSVVALIAIGGSRLLPDATWLDPTGGLIVSLMVIRAGWLNTGAALLELADVGMDEEIKHSIRKAATNALSTLATDEASVRGIQGVKAGQNYLVEVEVAVPGSWSVNEIDNVGKVVRERVGSQVRGVRKVRIRFVPTESKTSNFSDEFVGGDVNTRVSPEPQDEREARHENQSHDHHSNGDLRRRR
ncbi:MAG: hypothetical protein Q9191_005781 [Dirinaria sp. TL-2023a]